jgi:hypothetical protein
MRLDSNLSRPQVPNKQSAWSAEKEQARRQSRHAYDRWAAARQRIRRHSHGDTTATAATRTQAAQADTSSPPRASALCYANSLHFANYFCSDAVDSDDNDDDDDDGVSSKVDNHTDLLTLNRSLAFGGSIDTDDDDDNRRHHHHLHEGRMIDLATYTFESDKSDVSELQAHLGSFDICNNGIDESRTTGVPGIPPKQASRRSSGNVTPSPSNKRRSAAAAGTPNTCDITPPRSNSSSLSSTPISYSYKKLPRKRLELGEQIRSNSYNVQAVHVGGHLVAVTTRSSTDRINVDNNNEIEEVGTELVLINKSKSAAIQ